jgi:hypothetical protein
MADSQKPISNSDRSTLGRWARQGQVGVGVAGTLAYCVLRLKFLVPALTCAWDWTAVPPAALPELPFEIEQRVRPLFGAQFTDWHQVGKRDRLAQAGKLRKATYNAPSAHDCNFEPSAVLRSCAAVNMNTIVPLPASQKAAMMDYMFPNKCVDLENESFSASETVVYYESDQKRAASEPSVGTILGCRDRHPGRINPGTLCKVRRMVVGTSAVAVIGAARYREHRGLAVFKDSPSVYPAGKELFGTETFDVLTASQLEESAKVMVLDPASWMAVREKAHRRRKSDKDLTMAAMGGLDDNEWYYSLSSVIGEELDYEYPLENSRIAPNASMAPTLYTVCPHVGTTCAVHTSLSGCMTEANVGCMQNFMLKKAAVTKFVASIMQPYTDGHRYPPVLMETEVNKTYTLNGVLKSVKVVRVRQEPGSLKPHTLSIPCKFTHDERPRLLIAAKPCILLCSRRRERPAADLLGLARHRGAEVGLDREEVPQQDCRRAAGRPSLVGAGVP